MTQIWVMEPPTLQFWTMDGRHSARTDRNPQTRQFYGFGQSPHRRARGRPFRHSDLLCLGFTNVNPRGMLMIPEGDVIRLIVKIDGNLHRSWRPPGLGTMYLPLSSSSSRRAAQTRQVGGSGQSPHPRAHPYPSRAGRGTPATRRHSLAHALPSHERCHPAGRAQRAPAGTPRDRGPQLDGTTRYGADFLNLTRDQVGDGVHLSH